MLKGLKLSHFRGFKALEADLRPVSVVLGPNSSGKTSVLHAIRMAVDALAITLEETRPHLDDDGWITACWDHIVWDHDRLFPIADWEELFTDKATDGEGTMRIELAFDEADAIQELHVERARAERPAQDAGRRSGGTQRRGRGASRSRARRRCSKTSLWLVARQTGPGWPRDQQVAAVGERRGIQGKGLVMPLGSL